MTGETGGLKWHCSANCHFFSIYVGCEAFIELQLKKWNKTCQNHAVRSRNISLCVSRWHANWPIHC